MALPKPLLLAFSVAILTVASTPSLAQTNWSGNTVPLTVTSFHVPEFTDTSVTVAWAEPRDGGDCPVEGYTINHYDNSLAQSTLTNVSHLDRAHTFTALTAGSHHQFHIRAFNCEGEGEWSPLRSVDLEENPMGAPENVRITALNETHATVEWDAPSDLNGWEVTHYRLYISAYPYQQGGVVTHTEPSNIFSFTLAQEDYALVGWHREIVVAAIDSTGESHLGEHASPLYLDYIDQFWDKPAENSTTSPTGGPGGGGGSIEGEVQWGTPLMLAGGGMVLLAGITLLTPKKSRPHPAAVVVIVVLGGFLLGTGIFWDQAANLLRDWGVSL